MSVAMLNFLLSTVAITLPAVLAPGPMTTATLAAGTRNRHAGLMIAVGHAAVEFPLIGLLVAGLGAILKWNGVKTGIGLAGGAFLVLMGVQLLLSLRKRNVDARAPLQSRPFWTGVVLTGANPWFLVWWATVGMALASQAMAFGLIPLGLFVATHWLCDLVCLELLSVAGFKGSQAFGQKAQKAVAAGCAVLLVAFGLRFLWDAGMSLSG